MKNLVGSIKNRRVAYLEQVCERFAIMVYEVFCRELAIGFKSITYSYLGSPEDERVGTFLAHFVPWQQTDKYRHGHREIKVSFEVCALPKGQKWRLSSGLAIDVATNATMTIRFSHDRRRIAINIPNWDEIRYASSADHSSDAVTPLSKEPWGNLKDWIII